MKPDWVRIACFLACLGLGAALDMLPLIAAAFVILAMGFTKEAR